MTRLVEMSTTAIVVIAVYAAWLAATIAHQFHSHCPGWVKRLNVAGLLPIWTFFAPHPGMTDYYLLYRDRLPDGMLDNWRGIELKGRENGGRLAIWNPTKRKHKALTDLVSAIAQFVVRHGEARVIATVPYILILNYVSSQPHSLGSEATQFLILESSGYSRDLGDTRVLMLSQFHRPE
jgi:hypothetical protein